MGSHGLSFSKYVERKKSEDIEDMENNAEALLNCAVECRKSSENEVGRTTRKMGVELP